MDQPTSLEIVIKGKGESVKRAAVAAQKGIDRNTRSFQESNYVFGDGSDFAEKMNIIGVLGDYTYHEKEDGTAEYTTEQESYGCIWEENIKGIADAIIEVSPDVEIHIAAVITITSSEGYDLCVDVDYVDGELSIERSEDYYEDWDEEEDEEEDEDE